jgi:hypothetical protein
MWILRVLCKTNALLRSYFSNRYQRVIINNSFSNNTTFSEWGKIQHGAPQGIILGPLFFWLCIDDLPNIRADPSKTILFLDDANIIIKNPGSSKFNWGFNNIIDNINYADVNHFHWILIKLNFYNLCLK